MKMGLGVVFIMKKGEGEKGCKDLVTGVQTCALPILLFINALISLFIFI